MSTEPRPLHPRVKDITGQTFGRLTVVAFAGYEWAGAKRYARWTCQCTCGAATTARGSDIQSGNTRSCGCLRGVTYERHGLRDAPEYGTWYSMVQRCTNPRVEHFRNYGARGIRVCDRWRYSFTAFLEDMGPKPTPKHSIERKDTNGHYEPSNCIWATRAIQSRNTRRNRFYTIDGETLCLTDWAKRYGMKVDTLTGRMNLGWSIEKALTEPVGIFPERKDTCWRGHPLSGDNLYVSRKGARNCKACTMERLRQSRDRRKARSAEAA